MEIITGRISEGLKKSSSFTNLPWVREQFITKLGVDPYPGTLNLEVVNPKDLEKLKKVKRRKGIEIITMEPGFCSAKCFHVLVCSKINGALVIPQVPDYPDSKVEIISSQKIKDVVSLEIGDFVSVGIFW